MGDEAPEVTRCCVRDRYSFFDFKQDQSQAVEDALEEALFNSEPLGLMKAATLSVPLEDEDSPSTEEKSGDEDSTESIASSEEAGKEPEQASA